jgi:solute carrier family 25 carnitine/acylcarnitine transporter 20/29
MLGAGFLAGYGYWISAYPFDIIKTKLQTDSFTKPVYSGVVGCAKSIYSQGGIAGFFRGVVPCMMRAGPVNAGGFLAFEFILKGLQSRNGGF